jgi:hypothetical protein
MMPPVTSCTGEEIEPGRVALVQFGVNAVDFSLITHVTGRGAVDVRPMVDPPLQWGSPRRVSAADVRHLLTPGEVALMQGEDRLPRSPA